MKAGTYVSFLKAFVAMELTEGLVYSSKTPNLKFGFKYVRIQ